MPGTAPHPVPVPFTLFYIYFFGLAALVKGYTAGSSLFIAIGCVLLVLGAKNTADYFRARAYDKRCRK